MIRTNMRAIIISVTVLLMISIVSCDPSQKLAKQEKEDIQTYLGQNNTLTFVKQTSGLYYHEVVAGTGISPALEDSAYVKYTAMFLDGTVFDSSVLTGKLYGCLVYRNISGFSEGLTLMKQGGKSTILIPSKLAYGNNGSNDGYIPGYTPLLFDLELVKVSKYSVDWDN